MNTHRLLPALLVCLSSLSFVLNDTMTKFMIDRYHVSSIILVRSLIALPVLYLIHTYSTKRISIKTTRPGIHALRGIVGLMAAFLYIRSLASLSIAEVTVILFLSPIITSLIAWAFLGERVALRSWVAVFICFAGVLVAIQPGASGLKPAMALTAGASLLYAINAINSRNIPKEDNIWTIAFYGAAAAAIFIAPVSLSHWNGIALSDLPLFCAAACFSSMGIGLSATAYRMAAPSFLAPFSYSSLPWSLGVTWVFWQIAPSWDALIGTAIILTSTALNIRRRT